MRHLVIFISLILLSVPVAAQFVSLGFSAGLPQNEFRENTDATGFGGDLTFGLPFQKGVPIYFGLDFNYLVYGSNRQEEDLVAEIRLNNTVINQLVVPLEIVNTNSIFGTHALIRAQAPFEMIQPYIEGLIGFRYVSTNTKILDRSEDSRYSDQDTDVIVRKTVLDDWIFSYGYGGGFMIKVAPKFFVDLRANFFKGQRAQYFDGDDTSSWTVDFTTSSGASFDPDNVESGDLAFDAEPRESTTDLLELKLGVAFQF